MFSSFYMNDAKALGCFAVFLFIYYGRPIGLHAQSSDLTVLVHAMTEIA
jgi:hypothetical protein